MQNLRIGSIVNVTVGVSQTSDISTLSDRTVTNLTDAYIEYEDSSGTTKAVTPWHRVLNVTITTP